MRLFCLLFRFLFLPSLFRLFARRADRLERQGYQFPHRQYDNGRELEEKPANENERKQVDWLEARLAQRDVKVDTLYSEVRKLENEKLELVYKLHEKELQLKEAEMKKCEVRGCDKRQPPSDY